jgi:hypothetical protein
MDKKNSQEIIPKSSIPLWLDSYDDLFSDFDPRPYNIRALSYDFLEEAKRASIDRFSPLAVHLLVPERERCTKEEPSIKRRLKEHFQKHFQIAKRERHETIMRGIIFTVIGIILMFIATYILFSFEGRSFIVSFLIVVVEPGGWFLFWEGLDMLVFEAKRKVPDYRFYEKMSTCSIHFQSY